MSNYLFSYVTGPTGSISGESVLRQTADAINALGGYCVTAERLGREAATDAAAARRDAASALSTVNSALAGVPALTQTVSELSQAVSTLGERQREIETTANSARTEAGSAAQAASSAVQAVNAQNNLVSSLSSRVATAESTAGDAKTAAESASTTAGEAVTTANSAKSLASSMLSWAKPQNLDPVNQWIALQNIGAVPYVAPASVTNVDEEGVETVTTYDLTEEQRTQARENIGAAAAADVSAFGSAIEALNAGALFYSKPQTLTAVQQWQAAENAGAVPFIAPAVETVESEDGSTEVTHELTADQQTQARANINSMALHGSRGEPAGFNARSVIVQEDGASTEVNGSSADVLIVSSSSAVTLSIPDGAPEASWIKAVMIYGASLACSFGTGWHWPNGDTVPELACTNGRAALILTWTGAEGLACYISG